jgi:hypothetical protein
MRLSRFYPLLIPALIYSLSEVYNFWHKSIYAVMIICVFVFIYSSISLVKENISNEKWWNIFILPSYFTIGLFVFIAMLANSFLIQALFLLNVVFQYYYFKTIYSRTVKSENYQNYSLENLSAYGNFLSVYFISSSIYGLQSFLDFSVWLLMMIMLFFLALIIYQAFWSSAINPKNTFFYLLLFCLTMIEIAWSTSFLPLSYYIMGLLFALCFYILIGLLRFHLLGKLDKRAVKLYLIYGFSCMLLVFLTSRWL